MLDWLDANHVTVVTSGGRKVRIGCQHRQGIRRRDEDALADDEVAVPVPVGRRADGWRVRGHHQVVKLCRQRDIAQLLTGGGHLREGPADVGFGRVVQHVVFMCRKPSSRTVHRGHLREGWQVRDDVQLLRMLEDRLDVRQMNFQRRRAEVARRCRSGEDQDGAASLRRSSSAWPATSSAAALTYTTLFAVVPMMTVTFAMLSAVPAFQGVGEQIQHFIFRNFVPSTGAAVQEYLWAFTEQARQLTWVGVLLLAVTAFMMLVTIEQAFNTIWRVRKSRRGVSSFLLYWAILSLGPLLLGSGFAISTYLTSTSLLSGPDAVVGAKTLLSFTPLLFSVAAFTLIYATVPNARVPLKHALAGYWSRRINDEHRMVYRVEGDALLIAQLRYHY